MKIPLSSYLVAMAWGVLGLSAQEVAIPDKPQAAPVQTVPKPGKPSARKPHKGIKTGTDKAPPAGPQAEGPAPAPLVVEVPVPPPLADPPHSILSAHPAPPPVQSLETRAFARTRYLEPGRPMNYWRAALAAYTPLPLEEATLLSLAKVPADLQPLCSFYRIKGNNAFGPLRSTFDLAFLVNGPGFVIWLVNHEASAGELRTQGQASYFQFTFTDRVVDLWAIPTQKPEQQVLALGFHHGAIGRTFPHQPNTLVPLATGGVLAMVRQGHDVAGLFKFPLAENAIAMTGIWLDDEVWLEARNPGLISLNHYQGDLHQTEGITQEDRPRTLRLKVSLKVPRRIELSFIPRKGDDAYRMSADLREESALYVTAPDTDIRDLPGLAVSMEHNRAVPGWKADETQAGFPYLADQAFFGEGFEADLWNFSVLKEFLRPVCPAWKDAHGRQMYRALTFKAALKQLEVP